MNRNEHGQKKNRPTLAFRCDEFLHARVAPLSISTKTSRIMTPAAYVTFDLYVHLSTVANIQCFIVIGQFTSAKFWAEVSRHGPPSSSDRRT